MMVIEASSPLESMARKVCCSLGLTSADSSRHSTSGSCLVAAKALLARSPASLGSLLCSPCLVAEAVKFKQIKSDSCNHHADRQLVKVAVFYPAQASGSRPRCSAVLGRCAPALTKPIGLETSWFPCIGQHAQDCALQISDSYSFTPRCHLE